MSQAISLSEAVTILSILEQELEALQQGLNDVNTRIANLVSLKNSLAALREGSEDSLAIVDGMGVAMIRARIPPVEKVLVHIGLDIYMETGYEKALKLIDEMHSRLVEMRESLSNRYRELLAQYSELRNLVDKAVAEASRRQAARTGAIGEKK